MSDGESKKRKAPEQTTAVSSREAQVYDRQIRLWGLEAQKRMQASKILISGMRNAWRVP